MGHRLTLLPWPERRLTYDRVRRTHETARSWLDRIIADDVAEVFHGLRTCHIPSRRLAAAGELTKKARFFLVYPPQELPTLDRHVNLLFVMTAVGGLWPYFFRCDHCEKFGVLRQPARAHNFCSDECRAEFHRPAREAGRTRARAELRAKLQQLRAQGVPWLEACKACGLSSRRADELFKPRAIPQRH